MNSYKLIKRSEEIHSGESLVNEFEYLLQDSRVMLGKHEDDLFGFKPSKRGRKLSDFLKELNSTHGNIFDDLID
jgi:hypothetical protein